MSDRNTKKIYRDVLDHGKERVTHANILILGHVGAGKSSLVRTLGGKEFDPERHITEGKVFLKKSTV